MEDSELKSKYNSGVNIIMRLDSLWRETHSAVKSERYYLWNTLLDRIWCELARDLKSKEYDDTIKNEVVIKKGFRTQFDELNTKIANCGKLVDNVDSLAKGFDEVGKEVYENRANQYKALMEKDLFLRRLENHLGKGTAWDDDEHDGWD